MKPTQEQVIAWAREAGLWPAVTDTFPSEAERLAALAYEAGRKDENEACLDVCQDIWQQEGDKHNIQMNVLKCIEAIRARREQ